MSTGVLTNRLLRSGSLLLLLGIMPLTGCLFRSRKVEQRIDEAQQLPPAEQNLLQVAGDLRRIGLHAAGEQQLREAEHAVQPDGAAAGRSHVAGPVRLVPERQRDDECVPGQPGAGRRDVVPSGPPACVADLRGEPKELVVDGIPIPLVVDGVFRRFDDFIQRPALGSILTVKSFPST